MPIERYRIASHPRTQSTSRLHSFGRALTAALALGSAKAMADSLAPLPTYGAPTPCLPGAPLTIPRTPGFVAVAAPLPSVPPGVPGVTPAPNIPGNPPIPPNVIMQSFYAGLSEGLAQSGANNSYYVRQAGLGGQTFGLLFTNEPVACATLSNNTALMPAPSIEVCSDLASHGGSALAGRIIDPSHQAANATAVSFTNGLQATGIESGTVHLTTNDGFPIAFNYTAQACDTLTLLPECTL